MTGRKLHCAGLVALLALVGCPYTRISNFRGHVVDAVTHEPVPGASVDVSGRDNAAEHLTTDQNGWFSTRGSYSNLGLYPHIVPSLQLRVLAQGYDEYVDAGYFKSYDPGHPVTIGDVLLTRPGAPPAQSFPQVSCRRYIFDLDRNAPYLQSYYEANARAFMIQYYERPHAVESETVIPEENIGPATKQLNSFCRLWPARGYQEAVALILAPQLGLRRKR